MNTQKVRRMAFKVMYNQKMKKTKKMSLKVSKFLKLKKNQKTKKTNLVSQ